MQKVVGAALVALIAGAAHAAVEDHPRYKAAGLVLVGSHICPDTAGLPPPRVAAELFAKEARALGLREGLIRERIAKAAGLVAPPSPPATTPAQERGREVGSAIVCNAAANAAQRLRE